MKIRLTFDKKNIIRLLIAEILAAVMYDTVGFPWWVLLIYGTLYFGIKSLQIQLDPRFSWLFSGLLFVIGAMVSTFSIQHLLLEPELFAKTTTEKILLNVLCCLVFYLVIQIFTNNVTLTCVVSHLFFVILGFVDFYVYEFRQNEFTFSDFRSISTGLSVAGNYQLHLSEKGCYVIFACVLFIAFVRKFDVTFRKKWMMRLVSVFLAAASVTVISFGTAGVNTETWEKKGTYRNGYVLNFILSVRDSFIQKPKGYSRELIEDLEKQYGTEETNVGEGDKDPTIIVIMSESFADLSVIGDIETNVVLTPFLDSLSENTMKGYALSSVFGAKTPNSEWEYLTGNTMAFLPAGSVVYQQYINDTPSSLVSTLKERGYTCVAMHPYYDTGWSRNIIYPQIGYDEMYFMDAFDKTKILRNYISDEEFYSKIIDRYEKSGNREKLFIMGISMQNHGGYTTSYDNFEENVYKTGRSYTDANQYLSLVHESDRALRNFIEYFEQVEEPVEIVFFGDHQPSLTEDFYVLLNGKGLSGLTEEQLQDLYTVPFFIWTNYESKKEEVTLTSLNYLSTLTLERAGIKLPPYHQFLSDMSTFVSAINSRGFYSARDGCFKHIDEADGEEEEWILKYESLQYNSMFDKNNRSDVFFPYYRERK